MDYNMPWASLNFPRACCSNKTQSKVNLGLVKLRLKPGLRLSGLLLHHLQCIFSLVELGPVCNRSTFKLNEITSCCYSTGLHNTVKLNFLGSSTALSIEKMCDIYDNYFKYWDNHITCDILMVF